MRARTQSACTGAHLERNDGNVACVSCAVLLVLCCCLGIHACATRPHRRPPTGPHNGCMGRWHHQQSAQQADELNSMDGPTVNSGCHACMPRATPAAPGHTRRGRTSCRTTSWTASTSPACTCGPTTGTGCAFSHLGGVFPQESRMHVIVPQCMGMRALLSIRKSFE